MPIRYETKVSTPALASSMADVYSGATIEIANSDGMIFNPPRGLVGTTLHELGLDLLLGHDFLSSGYFGYGYS